MKNNQKLTVLVFGYDPYSDIWPIFDFYFSKMWKDCPYRKVFVSINKRFDNKSGFLSLTTNGEKDFQNRFLCGLSEVSSDYVLVLLEDYLLSSKPDNDKINGIISEMVASHFQFCQLDDFSRKIPLERKTDAGQMVLPIKIKQNRFYYLNLQASIWSVTFLRDFLSKNPCSRPWDFEVSMNQMFAANDCRFPKIGGMFTSGVSVVNGIDKGVLSFPAVKKLKKDKLVFPPFGRESFFHYFLSRLKAKISSFLPAFLISFLKKKSKKQKSYFHS